MAVSVRTVVSDDFVALMPLWNQLLESNKDLDVAILLRRIDESVAGGPMKLLVAWEGERAVGLVGLSVVETSTWSDHKAVSLHSLLVAKDSRHRGVAKALLRFAVGFADEIGAEEIIANIPSASRETARFFASFGFGENSIRRIACVSSLRRKFATREQIVSKGVVPRRVSKNDLLLRRATNK